MRRLLHFLECQVSAHAIFHGLALSLVGHDENEVVAIAPWVEVGSLLLEDLGDLLRKSLGFGANSQRLVAHDHQGRPAVPDLVRDLVGPSREGDHVELAACLTEDLADPLVERGPNIAGIDVVHLLADDPLQVGLDGESKRYTGRVVQVVRLLDEAKPGLLDERGLDRRRADREAQVLRRNPLGRVGVGQGVEEDGAGHVAADR